MASAKPTAKSDRPVDLLFRAPAAKPAPVLEPVELAPIAQVPSVPASSPVEAKAKPLPSSPKIKPVRKAAKAKASPRVRQVKTDDGLGDNAKSEKRRIRQSRSAPLRSIRIEDDVYEDVRVAVEKLSEELGARVTFQDATSSLLLLMLRDTRVYLRIRTLLREGRV